jgi:hypothetical protein
MCRSFLLVVTLCLSLLPPPVLADEYSPGVGMTFPKDVFFGDLHLHTNKSADAFSMGNRGLDAVDAYRFARGEEVITSNGLRAQLKRPLDFLAITDHSEFLGFYLEFYNKNPVLMNSSLGKRWTQISEAGESTMSDFPNSILEPDPVKYAEPQRLRRSIWTDVTKVADEFNDPGTFTTFSAYEWTSMTGGNNLHRCVIFLDDSATVSRVLPYTSQLSLDPEDLWRALEFYEKTTGCRVMAIPHNSNVSNGMMWDLKTLSGEAISADYASTRMRWEPVAEVTQIKGDSETHPLLAPTDEFADFERWDKYNIMNTVETTPEMLPGSYARSALQRGLAIKQDVGVNPYKFGMIGSTDDHTGLATAAEDNFFGKFANSEPGVRSPDSHMAGALIADWELGASGLAAVWAIENTREAIFTAMERKEVYATSGSRIRLRFFGGWDYKPGTIYSPDFVAHGYARGVPMGGDLARHEDANRAPTFLVYALKDPEGANLDRVQIMKGWIDDEGEQQQAI